MRTIINHGESCITLLHVMHPVGRSTCKNYSHSENKTNFGKIFKIQLFEVDINNNGLLVVSILILTTVHGRKGDIIFDCKSIER